MRWLRSAYEFVRDVYSEFNRDRGPLFAAAISFFGLISFVPLMLLAIGVFGYMMGKRADALASVSSFVQQYFPVGAEQIEEQLKLLSEQSGTLSIVGVLTLLWTGSQVFVIIQQVMNIAVGSSEKGIGLIRGRGFAMILVLVAGVLFALSLGITWLLAAVRALDLPFLNPENVNILWIALSILATTLVSSLAFAFVYKFAPTEEIGVSGPLVGGLTAGVLFEVAKYAFRWYVTNIVNFSLVYGSLGSVVVLVIWIYYVSLIAVIGAEVASVYARRKGEVEHFHRR